MGTVPIWKQWLMVVAGVFLGPVFVLLLAWFIGWPRVRRLWPDGRLGQGSLGRLG
jgi:hypothetical protein